MCPKWTYTRSPSVTGVGLAWLVLACGWGVVFVSSVNTNSFQSIFPLAASTHSARNSYAVGLSSPFGTAVVRYNLPFNSTGDDQPLPGIGIFQATLVSGPHLTGTAGP